MSHTRSSSHYRRSTSHISNDAEELSDFELVRQVNDLKHQVKMLTLENEVIEKSIMRLEPTLIHGVQQAMDYATRLQSNTELNAGSFIKSKTSTVGFGLDSMTSPSRMFASPSRISTSRRFESCARIGGTVVFGTGPKINVLERSELVSAEIEVLINVLAKAKKKAAKQHALLKAQLEEIGIREADFEKAANRFHQEVEVEGWDKIAQRIPAEIWIRYMTEWVKLTDRQIGKLRLRTSTLNTHYIKLNGQIRIKEELSESLRPVDFEKLKIENNECLLLIEQKLVQLADLKKMTGDANLTLTMHKKALFEQNTYYHNVMKNIKAKHKMERELTKESDEIQAQADNLEHKLAEVRKMRQTYEVPDIMDYVMVKSEVTDLKHSIKTLQNRLHIYEIALTSLNKKLRTMRSSI